MPEEVKPVEYPANSAMGDAMKNVAEKNAPVVVPEPVIEPNPPSGGLEPGGEPVTFTPELSKGWERLKSDGIPVPEDYLQGKFPEGKTEWDVFVDTILQNSEFEQENKSDDPFIENYLQVPPEKRDEYIEQYKNAKEFFKLPADDGLKAWYGLETEVVDGKEVPKWDEAAIQKHLDSLSPIQKEKEWNAAKGIAQKSFDDTFKKGAEGRVQEESARIETLNKSHLETAKALSLEIDKMTEFGGVTLTDDVKQSAKRNLIALTQIDPTTGRPHLLNLMNDNKRLMRMVVADTMINGDLVKEYIATQNEKFAEGVLEKLDTVPKAKSGSIGQPSGAHLPKP